MNRNKIKAYAPQARRDFIRAVTDRAALYGLTSRKWRPSRSSSGATWRSSAVDRIPEPWRRYGSGCRSESITRASKMSLENRLRRES